MKVKIDADLCSACGLCADTVPDVFKMADTAAEVINPDVPASLEKDVQSAVDDCPTAAIIIEK